LKAVKLEEKVQMIRKECEAQKQTHLSQLQRKDQELKDLENTHEEKLGSLRNEKFEMQKQLDDTKISLNNAKGIIKLAQSTTAKLENEKRIHEEQLSDIDEQRKVALARVQHYREKETSMLSQLSSLREELDQSQRSLVKSNQDFEVETKEMSAKIRKLNLLLDAERHKAAAMLASAREEATIAAKADAREQAEAAMAEGLLEAKRKADHRLKGELAKCTAAQTNAIKLIRDAHVREVKMVREECERRERHEAQKRIQEVERAWRMKLDQRVLEENRRVVEQAEARLRSEMTTKLNASKTETCCSKTYRRNMIEKWLQ